MTELNCENVCLAAMAMMDGAPAPLTAEAIENHLASCPACREEVEQLKALAGLLDAHERREHVADLWPTISARLGDREPRKASAAAARAFVFLSLLLLGYKLAEMIPEADLGLVFKLVPLVLVIAVFSYLKENPFKINAGLRLEGE
jgi:predicted anti-sigma-YlaC factor YlaD